MKNKISSFIDIRKFQSLMDSLYEMSDVPSSIVDLDGNVLVRSGWNEICIKFHRNSPQSLQKCIESDTTVANQLLKGKPYAIYECLNGLVDAAVPILIEGKHSANLFTGQFLFETPNPKRFREQAYKYNFDETSYLHVLTKVPIVSRERLGVIMKFMTRWAEMIGELGSAQKRQRLKSR
ncbi:MAG: hypothetical protein BWK80_26330 [Desulfobacteraceae bacterium IS3]|nr:MAG: hypothetical protein BWK80_26330 [Desulfobacteraceae bacterium IS3]